jgi:aspartate aminotransferase-like enzyme
MGSCTSNDLVATMSAMEMSLMELGHEMEAGAGVGAAEKVLTTLRTEA